MRIFITLFISLAIATTAHSAVIYPVPPSFWEKITIAIKLCDWRISCYLQDNLGATITTINATDRLSDSRSTINTNFTNLNNDKVENSTTTMELVTSIPNLATVGTITSGTWSGTTITVARGGTGTTTPTNLLWGNEAGALQSVDAGTTGQLLTSQGTSRPIWQSPSVNLSDNYAWTGNHSWTASTTQTATTTITAASTTPLILNSNEYAFPEQYTASGTALVLGENGLLHWGESGWRVLEATTTENDMSEASTTIPDGYRDLRVSIFTPLYTHGGTRGFGLAFNQDRTSGNYTYNVILSDSTAVTNEMKGADASYFAPFATCGGTCLRSNASIDIKNVSTQRKQLTATAGFSDGSSQNTTAVTADWSNTSAFITDLTFFATGSANSVFATSTEIVIWGRK